jgi:hypothetical protein
VLIYVHLAFRLQPENGSNIAAGSNIAIAGPSLDRPRSQVRIAAEATSHKLAS